MRNSQYILALDAGTTSLKAVLFDVCGNSISSSLQEYQLEKPSPGIVEVDPEVYWSAAKQAINELLESSDVSPERISSIGITSQGETLIVLDKNGRPLRKAIVWLDSRAVDEAALIADRFSLEEVYKITGQPEISSCWPASKILWLRRNEPEVFAETDKFLMLEDYLVYRLTGEFATDHALNPSTFYYDIRNHCWWNEMLDFLQISPSQLPELLFSGEVAGQCNANAGDLKLSPETKVTVAPIDQIAGAVGAGNIDSGMVTETTGSALAVCVTLDRLEYPPGQQIGVYLHAEKGKYVLLPWVPTAGMLFRWFRDELGCNKSYEELEREAAGISPGADNLTVIPHFSGAGTPDVNPEATGAFAGLTLAHTRGHITRAIFESVAFMLCENIELLEKTGIEIKEIISLGGASRSRVWMQIKADVLQKQFVLPECDETTCLGTAILSAVGTGIHTDLKAAKKEMVRIRKIIEPDKNNAALYDTAFNRYKKINTLLRK